MELGILYPIVQGRSTGNSAIQIGCLKSSGGGHFLDSVGIGTTNPQEKLHVLGTSSNFVVDTDSSVLRFGSYGEYDIALVTGKPSNWFIKDLY